MKGIILAGGSGTRLYPVTLAVCKQLLPVYDKPMVYYPLSTLMLAGIRDILVISTPEALPQLKGLLGNGYQWGIDIAYGEQAQPHGIAEALIIGESFIKGDMACLILGDNIFYGQGLSGALQEAVRYKDGATIFGYYVKEPCRYGVIGFDQKGRVRSVIEKPKKPQSNYAVTGLYFYDKDVSKIAKGIKPSARGELEITSVNDAYLKQDKLRVKLLGRGCAWLDMGTYDSLLEASAFIKTVQDRQGLMVGCIEEVAYRMGFITKKELAKLGQNIHTDYGRYIVSIAKDER